MGQTEYEKKNQKTKNKQKNKKTNKTKQNKNRRTQKTRFFSNFSMIGLIWGEKINLV